MEFPSPTVPLTDRKAVLLGYLDYFRHVVAEKVLSLPEDARRRSVVPTGWSPVDLVVHLAAMERRWLLWGFEGRDVGNPWSDDRDDRWYADPAVTTDDVLAAMTAQGVETARVVAEHALDELGRPGPRWDGADPATLERVLLHVLQEYARHAGHLDVAVEIAGGATGE